MLIACAPQHSRSVGFLKYEAAPGYQWVNPKALFLQARWTPGMANPDHPHIQSWTTQDEWIPDAGYWWGPAADAEPTNTYFAGKRLTEDLTVHWQPGSTRPDYPHVHAVANEGYWGSDKGYLFVKTNDLAVQWKPGLPDPDRRHYVSADTEGQWELAPGYVERVGLFGFKYVSWAQGVPNKAQPCLVSATTEGRWQPIAGYHTEKQADGHFRIVGDTTSPNWGGVLGGLVMAVVGFSNAQPRQNDGLFDAAVARPVAGEVGKAGLGIAARSFGSTNSGSCAGVTLDQTWEAAQ